MPKQLNIFINLLAMFVIAIIGVDIFYRVVRVQFKDVDIHPVESSQVPIAIQAPQKEANTRRIIQERNIFSATGTQDSVDDIGRVEYLEQTNLKLVLLGTITGDEDSGRAIISDEKTRAQNLYRVGDNIQGSVIKKIHRGAIVLRVDGRDEVLRMEEPSSGTSAKSKVVSQATQTASNYTLERRDINKSLEDVNALMSQVRVRPYFRNGKASGLIVSQIKSGSIFAELGLTNGDIIQGINGRDIRNTDDVINFYQSLKSSPTVDIQLTRKGQQKNITYNIR